MGGIMAIGLYLFCNATVNVHQIWLPEHKVVITYCNQNKTWSSNMVTGTEYGHQIWLLEQNMVIKYGYRNNFCVWLILNYVDSVVKYLK